LQLTHHHATMEVLRDGADASRIVWIADVFPNAAAGQVGPDDGTGIAGDEAELGAHRTGTRLIRE
jgi:hypothetical protein